MPNFYLQPYNPDLSGFYFDDPDEMAAEMAARGIEEGELQIVDFEHPELFRLLGINPATLDEFLDLVYGLSDDEITVAEYLAEMRGCSLAEIKDRLQDVPYFVGDEASYADHMLDFEYDIHEDIKRYIDVQAYADDLIAAGSIDVYKGIVICN